MKKPAKILLATALLAFAAAGFYYAWMSPAKKPATPASAPPIVRRDPVGPKVPAETAGRDLRESATMDRAAMPTPVPTPAPMASGAASNPDGARAASSGAAGTPEGFRATSAPAGSLPDRLEGFDKAPAGENSSVTTTTRPQTTPPPAGSSATGAPAAGNPAPLPPLPSPGGAVTPRPASVPPTTMPPATPAPAKPMAPVKPAETTYTVKAGDSLSGIWKQLTGSERGWERLQAANPGLDPSRLKIGQVLKVPPFEASAPAATPVVAGPGDYIVKEGDTLSSIAAERLGASKRWKEIYDANKATIGPDPAALKLGMKLVIPGQVPAKPTTPAAPMPPSGTKPATSGGTPPPVSMPPALPSMPGPGTPPPAATPSADSKGGGPGNPPPAPRST
jgi:nucleoid-associated protein YgaU